MKTVELTPQLLRNETNEYLQQYLDNDEKIVMCGKRFERGNSIYFLFTEYHAIWFAVRNKYNQLLFYDQPCFGSIPLGEVESIQERIIGWPPYIVELLGKNVESKVGFSFDKKDDFYFRFTKRLREQIDFIRTRSSVTNIKTSERLQQLKKLLDEGLITKTEFDKKRDDILNLL